MGWERARQRAGAMDGRGDGMAYHGWSRPAMTDDAAPVLRWGVKAVSIRVG
jgi:hypothetical protein